jgi:hypothetical protein
MHRIVFHGDLSAGVTREHALANLSRLFSNQTRERIEHELFTSHPVVVRRAPDRETAASYVRALRSAGIEVAIEQAAGASQKNGGTASGQPNNADAVVSAGQGSGGGSNGSGSGGGGSGSGQQPTPRHKRLLISVAVGVCLLIGAGAFAAWYTKPLWRANALSPQAERYTRALAMGGLVALAHLDVAHAAELESKFLGHYEVDQLAGSGDGLIASLERAGLSPREHIDDVLFATTLDEERGRPQVGIVALGDFGEKRIREWLRQRYDAVESERQGRLRFRLGADDPCSETYEWVASVHDGRLVAGAAGGSPEASAELVDRIAQRFVRDAAASVNLGRWPELQQRQIATAAIFGPADAHKLGDGQIAQTAGLASKALSPVDALYAGMTPTVAPPGLTLGLTAQSGDKEWLDEIESPLRDGLADLRSQSSDWPELRPLYERIEIERSEESVAARMQLDESFDDELRKLATATVQYALKSMFGGTPSTGSGQAEIDEEEIVDEPQTYEAVSRADLTEFGHWGQADGFEWQNGPFGVQVKKAGLGDDGAPFMEILAEARALPNGHASESPVRMRINQIVDASGDSLLAERGCDEDDPTAWNEMDYSKTRNAQGDEVSGRYNALTHEQTLQLREGAAPADVTSIEGQIEYRMPMQVKQGRIDTPLRDKTVREDEVRLHFKKGKTNQVNYAVEGDPKRVLAVRALNQKGEVLRQRTELTSGRFFASGHDIQSEYMGQVATVEYLIASEVEKLELPFVLEHGLPAMKGKAGDRDSIPSFDQESLLERASQIQPPESTSFEADSDRLTRTGPFLLRRSDFLVNAALGLLGQLYVEAKSSLPLKNRLNVAFVRFDHYVGPDGEKHGLDQGIKPLSFKEELGNQLEDYVRLQVSDYEGAKPSRIAGEIKLRESNGVAAHTADARIGSELQVDGFSARVIEWLRSDGLNGPGAKNMGTVRLRLEGEPKRLVTATAWDGQSRRIDSAVEVSSNDDGQHFLNVSTHDTPSRLELHIAGQVEQKRYPFRLELTE